MLITDVRSGESDILVGREKDVFTIRAICDGRIMAMKSEADPWNHERLDQALDNLRPLIDDAADYFIGTQWIGSTEL